MFQFTRPRGARLFKFSTPPRVRRFNSRAHGGRDEFRGDGVKSLLVSIHAPTGGATESAIITHPPMSFNSRAHGGRDLIARGYETLCRFQFTRPRGARPGMRTITFAPVSFNSRAHGGRDQTCRQTAARTARFNSRAHGGRDLLASARTPEARVSIHAPTGGATSSSAMSRWIVARFNSRAHGGRDTRRGCPDPRPRVSIHAPTGGATHFQPDVAHKRFVSIHAPTGGATRVSARRRAGPAFQFTRPRGARLRPVARPRELKRFNSRAHGGRD